MVFAALSSIFYLTSVVLQFLVLNKKRSFDRRLIIGSGIVAVVFHGVLAWQQIILDTGVDLGFFKIASLVAFFLGFLLLFSSLKKPLENLFTALFPISILVIWVSTVVTSSYTPRADFETGILSHILISILAYSVLTICAAHAVVLIIQDRRLKSHHTSGLFWALPPLQTMERLLFELLVTGFVLLTLAIVSGLMFVEDMMAQHIVHKSALTVIAWIIYGILIWGHFYLGWRGRVAARWTISGFLVLFTAFVGSRFVLELLLNRV